ESPHTKGFAVDRPARSRRPLFPIRAHVESRGLDSCLAKPNWTYYKHSSFFAILVVQGHRGELVEAGIDAAYRNAFQVGQTGQVLVLCLVRLHFRLACQDPRVQQVVQERLAAGLVLRVEAARAA